MLNRFCLKALLLAGFALPIVSCSNSGLSYITISPTTANVAVGQSVQFTAWGYYGNAKSLSNKNITSEVTWAYTTSALTPCAVVPVVPGCYTAVSAGAATVGITDPGFGGTVGASATVTITASTGGGGGSTEPYTAVSIIPATQSIVSGQTSQLIALVTKGTGGQVDMTGTVSWSSSNNSVATVGTATKAGTTAGLVTAVNQGTATITATAKNPDNSVVTATATITVTGSVSTEPLLSVAIIPGTQSMAAGQASQLIAIGTLTPSATTPASEDLTNTITWASSNKSVATVGSAEIAGTIPGLVKAVGAGTAVITATDSKTNPDHSVVTGTSAFTVTAALSTDPLQSLSIIPSPISAPVGQSTDFFAIGTFLANSTPSGTQNMANVSSYTVKWYSSNPSVATIDLSKGIAVGVVPGTTAITAIATYSGAGGDMSVVTATTTFTVIASGPSALDVTSLTIFPQTQSIPLTLTVGGAFDTAQYYAIGTNVSTGLQMNETSNLTWNSSDPAVAVINGAGIATAQSPGTTTLTAFIKNSDGSVATATASLTVFGTTTEPLNSVSILPANPTVAAPNQTSQLLAIGNFSSAPITQDITKGLASPAITTKWSSSNKSVATVGSPEIAGSTPGLVTGLSQGTVAIVTVSSNPDGTLVTSSTPFSVLGGSAEAITALTVEPSQQTATFQSQQTQFMVLGTAGNSGLQFDETSLVKWRSSNLSVATISSPDQPTYTIDPITKVKSVDPWGMATAVGSGVTTITATWTNQPDGSLVVASATYTVNTGAAQEPLISINIVPGGITVSNKGMTGQFLAFGTYSTTPTVRDLTNLATWISTSPEVASVSSGGVSGATGGLATAMGYTGNSILYAQMANTDGTVVLSNPQTFTCLDPNTKVCDQGVATPQLATITVYNAGQNHTDWLVTAPSDTGVADLIHCGPGSKSGGSVCTGIYETGSVVVLTESPTGTGFGGWSGGDGFTGVGCVPATGLTLLTSPTCTVTLTGDTSVGAIFY